MNQVTAPSYDVCDACRRPILQGDGTRLIHGYRIHNTDDCFDAYATKVERRLLEVPYNLTHAKTDKEFKRKK